MSVGLVSQSVSHIYEYQWDLFETFLFLLLSGKRKREGERASFVSVVIVSYRYCATFS